MNSINFLNSNINKLIYHIKYFRNYHNLVQGRIAPHFWNEFIAHFHIKIRNYIYFFILNNFF